MSAFVCQGYIGPWWNSIGCHFGLGCTAAAKNCMFVSLQLGFAYSLSLSLSHSVFFSGVCASHHKFAFQCSLLTTTNQKRDFVYFDILSFSQTEQFFTDRKIFENIFVLKKRMTLFVGGICFSIKIRRISFYRMLMDMKIVDDGRLLLQANIFKCQH